MRSILLDIIPRRFRRRSYLVSGTIFLRALLNFAGLALLIPVLLLILDSESMHTNPWLERLYQAGGFESDRAFALTVCGCIVALIAFKNLLNLFLLRYERRYIYDLYRCMSRRLYIEYHDRGLGFIKNTNSALLSRNVNFVCLAFVTGILVPLASITSESMLLALLFTALLFYNPTVAGLVLLVFIPTVWFYYSAVRTVTAYRRTKPSARRPARSSRPSGDMPTWRSTMPFLRCCAASTGRWTRSLRFSPEI